mmetsp:Transcript_3295/g.8549  ORF Transcript_3295/g.8549 Transcript_3295/m.8549 type:complete len:138 (-) Transcript_3295:253-666(-)
MFNDFKKIGMGLTGFGLLFTFLGVMLLFDKTLLSMGNVLFLSGVTMITGAERAVTFFFTKKKARGSSLFFSGIVLVLVGWPIVGILVEAFGFVNLFGDFFPVAVTFARQLPVIGNVLDHPRVKPYVDKFVSANKLPV